jgi:nicotinate-nucleotide adenylyltransferase
MDPAQRDSENQDTEKHGLRVAFFGGSFDPPHLGHLAVARAARDALGLDAVLFAPVGTQALKPHGAAASFDDRLEMTRLAIAGERGFEVSLIDAPRADQIGRPNYTIDTLTTLRAVLPKSAALFCLMGADSLLNLRQWHRAAEIPFAAEIIVASRPGQPLESLAAALPKDLALEPVQESVNAGVDVRVYLIRDGSVRGGLGRTARFYVLPGLHVEISASAIRAQAGLTLDEAQSENQLLPVAVSEYIRAHGLYS